MNVAVTEETVQTLLNNMQWKQDMAYQVTYKVTGEGLKDSINVFDETQTAGQQFINIFNNYVANDWITQYDRKDITDTHVEDTLVFVSKEKRDEFKADMSAVTTDLSTVSLLTLEIISEEEVQSLVPLYRVWTAAALRRLYRPMLSLIHI